jgi:hypothetical protein
VAGMITMAQGNSCLPSVCVIILRFLPHFPITGLKSTSFGGGGVWDNVAVCGIMCGGVYEPSIHDRCDTEFTSEALLICVHY